MADDELLQVASARLGRVLRGKYRLDRVLGVGGMAAVYAATHRNKKKFAIKMLHSELSLRENIRTRFLREGYVANSVEHPGAVAVLDDDVAEDGSAFLVMELLEGAPLDAIAERNPGHKMALGLTVSIGDALLDVLAAAHAKKIVHRDLKPANLFLTNDGRLAVLDFGIARLHDETSPAQHATQTGAMLGTPAFMAPEQALAESSKIDAQTDLWAAGATLFTLLSGALVHEGDNASQLMIRAATSKARSLATIAPEVPKAIAAVIDRALAFEKKDRWESATAMKEALAKACVEATGAAIAPLPKSERVTGLESTVASDGGAPASSAAAFEATMAAPSAEASAPRPAMTTGQAMVASQERTLPSAKPPPPRSRAIGLVALVAIASATIVGAMTWQKSRESSAATPVPSASASAPRAGRPPATTQAAAAYEAATQADHDGNPDEAERNLKAAIASDPALGAAHLRLALRLGAGFHPNEADAHAAYLKAVEHRATLGEVDAALLEAYEPRFRDPPDRVERTKRLDAVAKKYPGDPFVQTLLAQALGAGDDKSASDAAVERALAIDARYVPAYAQAIDNADGDDDKEAAVVDRCLRAAPSAVTCLVTKMDADSESGRCADMKADARRILAVDPDSHAAYGALAEAMFALGEPMEGVAEALRRSDEHAADEGERRYRQLLTEETLALVQGDLGAALKGAGERAALAAAGKVTRDPFEAVFGQIDVAFEEGDKATARDLVKRARTRLAVGATSERDLRDEGPLALAAARSGLITRDELHAEQRALLEDARRPERSGGPMVPFFQFWWVYVFGLRDEVDARDSFEFLRATGQMREDGGLVDDGPFPREAWGMAGRQFALGGRYAEALPLLDGRAKMCVELEDFLKSQQLTYLLGLSREKTGDLAGAKAAYEHVLARWGNAKPRSLTADRARAALARLGK